MKLSIPREIFPVMGEQSIDEIFTPIDLSITNSSLPTEIDYISLANYVDQYIEQHSGKYAIGGYLENRNLYGLSNHFSGSNRRDIHLGIDIWTDAHHPVYAPLSGHIHSYAYNDQHLDYGYTLILRHEFEGSTYHTLYGHLGQAYYDSWQVGQRIESGTIIGSLGDRSENGGWPPHLHFQVIVDMQDWNGDYPGVCSKSELEYYTDNCPNPTKLILA